MVLPYIEQTVIYEMIAQPGHVAFGPWTSTYYGGGIPTGAGGTTQDWRNGNSPF
jgi:hypothetical protein